MSMTVISLLPKSGASSLSSPKEMNSTEPFHGQNPECVTGYPTQGTTQGTINLLVLQAAAPLIAKVPRVTEATAHLTTTFLTPRQPCKPDDMALSPDLAHKAILSQKIDNTRIN